MTGSRGRGKSAGMAENPCNLLHIDSPGVWEVTRKTLRDGGLVAFCTESTYGIGASLSAGAGAMERLAALKGRDGTKPFPLVGASAEVIEALCELPSALRTLGRRYWPGPLTVAGVPRAPVPSEVLSAGGTVGIRVSSHPVAKQVAALAGGVVTATSANYGGMQPAKSVAELGDLMGEVDLVLDSGPALGGPPSTVVGWGNTGLVIYREGALSTSLLLETLAEEEHLGE